MRGFRGEFEFEEPIYNVGTFNGTNVNYPEYKKFTICRPNIIDRFVSAYIEDHKNRSVRIEDTRSSIIDYIDKNDNTAHNTRQIDWLIDENGSNIEMDYILNLSNLQYDFDKMIVDLKIDLKIDFSTNIARVNKKEDKKMIYEFLDEEIINKIIKKYHEDTIFLKI
jgi:hypothetical protein